MTVIVLPIQVIEDTVVLNVSYSVVTTVHYEIQLLKKELLVSIVKVSPILVRYTLVFGFSNILLFSTKYVCSFISNDEK